MHPLVSLFREWRYLLLLGALLALLVIQPVASAFGVMESLFDALLAVVLLVLVLILAQEGPWRVLACILGVSAAALSVGGRFMSSSAQSMSVTLGHALGALFFVAVAGRIVQSLFTSRRLSADSVFGAICGYLLLGVAWALTYATVYSADHESFRIDDLLRPQMEQGDNSRNIFVYYSFVTLTTVGYGDITPASIPARTLAWLEALTGQLYLAVLIAGLMSALVARNTSQDSGRS